MISLCYCLFFHQSNNIFKRSLHVEEKSKTNDTFKHDNHHTNHFRRFFTYTMDIVNDTMCFGCPIVVVKDLFLRGDSTKII